MFCWADPEQGNEWHLCSVENEYRYLLCWRSEPYVWQLPYFLGWFWKTENKSQLRVFLQLSLSYATQEAEIFETLISKWKRNEKQQQMNTNNEFTVYTFKIERKLIS